MKHIPIIFSTPMVQAIRDGRKTQTRRVVKARSYISDIEDGVPYEMTEDDSQPIKCPYGQPGDVIWVRETFAHTSQLNINPEDENYGYVYKADGQPWEDCEGWKWKPSIFMPREACRLFLRIKSVRVERLQEITCQDVLAEGMDSGHSPYFITLWQSIHGHESWKANPWVWVIEFDPISREEAGE